MSLTEEFESQDRLDLLEKLQRLIEANNLTHARVENWAALWVADVESLRRIASHDDPVKASVFVAGNPMILDAVEIWANRRRVKDPWRGNTNPSSEASTPTGKRQRTSTDESQSVIDPNSPLLSAKKVRSQVAIDNCLQRDSQTCVITHADQMVEAAHIFPLSLGNSLRGEFWASLRAFWTAEHVKQWEDAILGGNGTEKCENLITLSPSAHAYWDRCLFALKPRPPSADMKTMEVEFFWLPANKRKDIAPYTILTSRPDLRSDLNSTGRCVKLLNGHTDCLVKSGDVITFKTHNPQTHPLPSYHLLQMQWVLHRIAAIRGAADSIEYDDDEDDDEDDEE
ncbi:hypothetical protein DTO207G8_5214 [Paecilomyces variotii]|nr:hypothetical protein DTO207G8_5214 [Paecilomyces variotii]